MSKCQHIKYRVFSVKDVCLVWKNVISVYSHGHNILRLFDV